MDKPVVDKEYLNDIEKARRELRALIYKKSCAPLMLRLAWQDACTYDPESQIKGGPNGSIRSEQELEHSQNKGLKEVVQYCEDVKGKLRKVSYADLYQLAGVVAVEVTGGPTIDFLPGRTDSGEPPQEGRLPKSKETGASHLRDIFITRMGLSDQDIVALYGGHTLGKAYEDDQSGHKGESIDKGKAYEDDKSNNKGESIDKGKAYKDDRSSNKGEWTGDPFKFDNSYFVELLKKNASLLRIFPADIALVEDRKFRKYVEKYATDEDAFFKDYAAAHKKFSELGWNLKETPKKLKLIKPKLVIKIVIVSTVVLSYLRKRKNNQLKK